MRQGGKTRDKTECKTTTVKRELGVGIKEMGHKGFRDGH